MCDIKSSNGIIIMYFITILVDTSIDIIKKPWIKII